MNSSDPTFASRDEVLGFVRDYAERMVPKPYTVNQTVKERRAITSLRLKNGSMCHFITDGAESRVCGCTFLPGDENGETQERAYDDPADPGSARIAIRDNIALLITRSADYDDEKMLAELEETTQDLSDVADEIEDHLTD